MIKQGIALLRDLDLVSAIAKSDMSLKSISSNGTSINFQAKPTQGLTLGKKPHL